MNSFSVVKHQIEVGSQLNFSTICKQNIKNTSTIVLNIFVEDNYNVVEDKNQYKNSNWLACDNDNATFALYGLSLLIARPENHIQ